MTDEQAWKLAIGMYRARGRSDAAYIDEKLEREGFRSAGRYAAYSCQFRSLHAPPWAVVPCSLIEPIEVVLARGAGTPEQALDYEAAVLAKRLQDAGLSIWHPDPQQALREIEPAA
jgi:hypothetical protein